MAARRFLVKGRVQGVGYRYFVLQEATRLGVSGFARNLPGGGVEVVAEGTDSSLETLAAQLREGPSFARVESVEAAETASRDDVGFHIR